MFVSILWTSRSICFREMGKASYLSAETKSLRKICLYEIDNNVIMEIECTFDFSLLEWGAFGWGANLNGMAPFQFLRMEPFRSTFGKKNGAALFFVWLESALD
jgi:hypothetical protein